MLDFIKSAEDDKTKSHARQNLFSKFSSLIIGLEPGLKLRPLIFMPSLSATSPFLDL